MTPARKAHTHSSPANDHLRGREGQKTNHIMYDQKTDQHEQKRSHSCVIWKIITMLANMCVWVCVI